MAFNSKGHRSLELENPKPANEDRIYFMGTSIALGWGVGQKENYPAFTGKLLSQELSPKTGRSYVSVNAGVANFNTLKELALFKHDLKLVRPDVVILQYYPRDTENGPERKDSELIKSTYMGAYFYRRILGLISAGEVSLPDHFLNLHQDGDPRWEKTKTAILELKKITASRKLLLAVVIIPELRNPSPDGPYGEVYAKAKAFFKSAKIDVIDPGAEVFRRLKEDPRQGWVHSADPHPNAEIHKIIARKILFYLAKRLS